MVRRGVSVYLEVFTLVGVALLGSAMVFAAVSRYAPSAAGAGVSVSDLTIRQGSGAALERMVVSDTGTTPIPGLVVATSGVAPGAEFCYSASNVATSGAIAATCPGLEAMPSAVTLSIEVAPGESVVVAFAVEGSAFAVGSTSSVIVTASNGAQAVASATVLPA